MTTDSNKDVRVADAVVARTSDEEKDIAQRMKDAIIRSIKRKPLIPLYPK